MRNQKHYPVSSSIVRCTKKQYTTCQVYYRRRYVRGTNSNVTLSPNTVNFQVCKKRLAEILPYQHIITKHIEKTKQVRGRGVEYHTPSRLF